jgi:glycosyltransferase involved in cell wall biosynthesis
LRGWELHISGHGSETSSLKELAAGCNSIFFRGLLNREEHARLLCDARIGVNPHDLSASPGNVFAFKIVEYLAAGNHVLTTPMGPLESELEAGITYMPDNQRETIASSLAQVIQGALYERRADEFANQQYGPEGVSRALDALLREVADERSSGSVGAAINLARRYGPLQ